MKLTKKMIPAAVAASIFAGAMGATSVATAETAASVSISNMYLWRGIDLGNSAAISGDLSYSHDSGLHTGIWASSGDGSNEYDLWVGYGGESGDFTYDVSLWTYVYPDGNTTAPTPQADEYNDPGKLSEIILTLGYQDFSFSYYDNIADQTPGASYTYMTFSYSMDKYSATLGMADPDIDGADTAYTHLDLGYAVTDNLSLTLSTIVDRDDDTAGLNGWDDRAQNRTKVQLSYNVPL